MGDRGPRLAEVGRNARTSDKTGYSQEKLHVPETQSKVARRLMPSQQMGDTIIGRALAV